MTFEEAVRILMHLFTRDDYRVGFVVEWSASPLFIDQGEYIAVWKAVREHFHEQTEPAKD